jgi:hypothetical protein
VRWFWKNFAFRRKLEVCVFFFFKSLEYVGGLRGSSVGSDVIIECLVRTYPFEAEAILKGFYVDFDKLGENAPACGCGPWGSN